MDFLNDEIARLFSNINLGPDGYIEQEDRIVESVLKSKEQPEYRTTMVYAVYEMMNN